MKTRRIVGCMLAAVLTAGLAAQAQWERIPIEGGHFERLVKHPFKVNELYGIVEKYGIYRSTDQGYTWANWLRRTTEHPWINIAALTFTKDGSALMIANGYPYLSRDDGITWMDLSGPLGRQGFFVYAHVDTSGRITLFNDRSKSFLTSSDSCRTWTEVILPTEIRNRAVRASMDHRLQNVIFLSAHQFIAISFDYGRSWRTSSISDPECSGRVFLPRILATEPHLRLGVWLDGHPDIPAPHYFESLDSGKTWKLASISHPRTKGGYTPYGAFLPGIGRTMYLVRHGDVHLSSDSGRTWTKRAEQCWDLEVYDDHIVGSFVMDGTKISTDGGETWAKDRVSMPDGIIPEVHFSVTRDTITALLVDVLHAGPALRQLRQFHQLRQSSDRGLTWKTLFTTTSALEQLTLTSNPSLRYYVISNGNTLLRGTFGQEVPDTLLTLERKPIQWPTNIPSIHLFISAFGYIYLSAPDIGLYWSTDGGDTWGRSNIPWGMYAFFRAVPSKEHRDRLLATASSWDPMVPTSGGKFLTHNRGASWILLDRDDNPGEPMFYTGDTLYYTIDQLFSGDYGQTWFRNRKGIDTALSNLAFVLFETDGRLFFGCDSAWYKYSDGVWMEILGPGGERLRDRMTSDAAIDSERLYVFKPYEGLYVLRSPTLTGIGGYSTVGPESATIQAYPNPATEQAIILLPEHRGDPPESIVITDVMGRYIRSIPVQPMKNEQTWDLSDEQGQRVCRGVYYLTVSNRGAQMLKGTVVIY